MAITFKFNSRQTERTENEIITTVCWTGNREEIVEFSQADRPGTSTDDGTLKSSRVYQESPNIWVCEKKYATDLDGESQDKPNTEYGKKSAQLHGSTLCLPLEKLPQYRKKWNHFLVAAPGVNTVPAWWDTADYNSVMSSQDSQKYRWVKSLPDAPVDKNGYWHDLKAPIKPGQDSYEISTYSITETAKFRSARSAGRMVAGKLNQIGKPDEDFGLTPSGYNWKCDNATVSWNGKYWLATLTWTRSGNNKGWDPDTTGQ